MREFLCVVRVLVDDPPSPRGEWDTAMREAIWRRLVDGEADDRVAFRTARVLMRGRAGARKRGSEQ